MKANPELVMVIASVMSDTPTLPVVAAPKKHIDEYRLAAAAAKRLRKAQQRIKAVKP